MKGFSSTSSQVFSQKPGELWNAISKENNLNDTHPFCKENEILVWNDENHQDKLVYLNGLTFIREFSEGLKVLAIICGLEQNVVQSHMLNGELQSILLDQS